MPKKQKPVVVLVPLTQAMEMHVRGFAEISTGEVKLTPAGRKALGRSAVGVKLYIEGTKKPPQLRRRAVVGEVADRFVKPDAGAARANPQGQSRAL